jgi:thioredoxin-dependent peroxiredoxin
VSYDASEDNRAWSEMMGFGFPLLSDTDHAIGLAQGVERDPDDRRYGWPKRVTYLLDPAGIVRRSYLVTDNAAHAEEVLGDLRSLRDQ